MGKQLNCPSCKKLISVDAVICLKCGDPLKEGWVKEAEAKSRNGCFVILAIIAIPFLMFLLIPKKKNTEEVYVDRNITVYSKDFANWPYPNYTGGILYCQPYGANRQIITITLGGKVYGLNGTAMSKGGYPKSQQVMKRDPEYGAYELGDADKLIAIGKSLCD